MNENINLISNIGGESVKEEEALKYLRLTAVLLLITILFLALVIFVFKTSFGISALKKQENSLSSNLSALNNKTVKLLLIQERLKSISDVIKTRSDFNNNLDLIRREMPQGLSIDSLLMNKKNVSLTISSYSLYDINVFLENLQKIAPDKKTFSKLIFNSLAVDDTTGRYMLVIDID